MERKNSLVSITTQTCDREMVGTSEFIDIPINNNNLKTNNIEEINIGDNNAGLNNENKHLLRLYNKSDNLMIKNNINYLGNPNFNSLNISNTNKYIDYTISQNVREKTELTIQLQNIQRELDKEIEMNKKLQEQVDNYKDEFNKLKEELNKKMI